MKVFNKWRRIKSELVLAAGITTVIILGVVVIVLSPQKARAQWAVFDATSFRETAMTANNSIKAVTNQVKQIAHQVRSIDYQIKALERVADKDYWRIGRGGITDQLDKIERVFRMTDRADRSLKRVIESSKEMAEQGCDVVQCDSSVNVETRHAWSGELIAAVEGTAASQIALTAAQASVESTLAALENAEEAESIVAQLQSTNTLIANVSILLVASNIAASAAATQNATALAVSENRRLAIKAEEDLFLQPAKVDPTNGKVYFGPGKK